MGGGPACDDRISPSQCVRELAALRLREILRPVLRGWWSPARSRPCSLRNRTGNFKLLAAFTLLAFFGGVGWPPEKRGDPRLDYNVPPPSARMTLGSPWMENPAARLYELPLEIGECAPRFCIYRGGGGLPFRGLMPLAERAVLALRCINLEGTEINQLMLRWPAGGNHFYLALPLKVCPQDMILAIPGIAIPTEVLEETNEDPWDPA